MCSSDLGHVESSCGDWVHITLRLDDDRRIEDCRFTAFGCGSAVASASVITEMAKGKSIEEAGAISTEDVVTYLGGLPENKTHCSAMSHAAFKAAVDSTEIVEPVS